MRAKVGIRTLNHMGLTYNFLTDWWFRIGLRLQFFFFNHIFWVLFCNFLLPCWSFQTFRSLVSHARCGEAIEASSKGILEKEAQIKTAEDIDPWKLEPKWSEKGQKSIDITAVWRWWHGWAFAVKASWYIPFMIFAQVVSDIFFVAHKMFHRPGSSPRLGYSKIPWCLSST